MTDAGLVPLSVILRSHEGTRQAIASKLLFQAAQALSAMHSAGTVHGDLRCENILVSADLQRVSLGGLEHSFDWNALRYRVLGSEAMASDQGISVSSAVRWLAPECVAGAVPTPASDMYAFGMTMFEALSGALPFQDLDEASIVDLKKKKETTLPDPNQAKIDREAWSLIQDACHHNPIFRPSVQIAMMTLRNLQSKPPTVAYPALTHFVTQPPNVIHTHSLSSGFATAPTHVGTSAYAAMPTYQYPISMSTPQQASSVPRLTANPTTTVWQSGETKVVPAGSAAVPVYTTTPGQVPGAARAPMPLWKKLTGVVVLVAIALSIVVPEVLAGMSSTTSSDEDDDDSPTPTPSPSGTPSSTWTPSPTTVWTPYPAPSPSPSSTPEVTTPTPTTRTPVVLPVRLSTSGVDLVATVLRSDVYITGIVAARDGTVYVSNLFVIYSFREDTSTVTHIAGSGTGYVNGPVTDALFGSIQGIAIDADGNLLVADGYNLRLRRVRFDKTPYTVEDVAGNGERDTYGGSLMQAAFKSLTKVAVSPTNGMIYVTSNADGAVRKVDITNDRVSDWRRWIDSAIDVAVSPNTDQVFVTSGNKLVAIPVDGSNTWRLAGTDTQGYKDGNSFEALFTNLGGLAFSSNGKYLYISDTSNHCIRVYEPDLYEVSTLAGSCATTSGDTVDGDYTTARFVEPRSVSMGPTGTLFVVQDGGYVRAIKVTP